MSSGTDEEKTAKIGRQEEMLHTSYQLPTSYQFPTQTKDRNYRVSEQRSYRSDESDPTFLFLDSLVVWLVRGWLLTLLGGGNVLHKAAHRTPTYSQRSALLHTLCGTPNAESQFVPLLCPVKRF